MQPVMAFFLTTAGEFLPGLGGASGEESLREHPAAFAGADVRHQGRGGWRGLQPGTIHAEAYLIVLPGT